MNTNNRKTSGAREKANFFCTMCDYYYTTATSLSPVLRTKFSLSLIELYLFQLFTMKITAISLS